MRIIAFITQKPTVYQILASPGPIAGVEWTLDFAVR
jgi:hypothetical protein